VRGEIARLGVVAGLAQCVQWVDGETRLVVMAFTGGSWTSV